MSVNKTEFEWRKLLSVPFPDFRIETKTGFETGSKTGSETGLKTGSELVPMLLNFFFIVDYEAK